MQNTLLILASIILLISPTTYIISIFRAETRPHRLTRLAVGVATLLAFFSILTEHGNAGSLVLLGILSLQSIVIFGLSLWRGMGGGSWFDWMCFALAIAGLIGWQVSGNALVAMWFAIFADTAAYIPALVKTWKHPKTESQWFYILGNVGALLTLAAYELSITSTFQIYIIIMNSLMLVCIYKERLLRKLSMSA